MGIPDLVISGAFTIFGTLAGGAIGFAVTRYMENQRMFNAAAVEFTCVFHDIVCQIDPRFTHDDRALKSTYDVLFETFPNQVKAMMRFRIFLNTNKRTAFDEAWADYCHYPIEGEPDTPFLAQYYEELWQHLDTGIREATRGMALRRIRKLLTIAELDHHSPFEPQIEV